MNIYEKEISEYNELNKISKENGIVFLGSSFAKNIPASELAESFNMDCVIYNRSITDLSIFDTPAVIENCVAKMYPDKIFLQLGETDLASGYRTITEILNAYQSLILKIKNCISRSEIIILSVCDCKNNISTEEFNRALLELSRKMKCDYVDITTATTYTYPFIRAFEMLKPYMRNGKMSFCDALNMVHT